MSRRPLAWTASWLPLAVGAFLALVGVGTLVGAPWRYAASESVVVVAAFQILGSLSAIAVGLGVAWLEASGARKTVTDVAFSTATGGTPSR